VPIRPLSETEPTILSENVVNALEHFNGEVHRAFCVNVLIRKTEIVERNAISAAVFSIANIPKHGMSLYPSRGSLRFRCGNTTTERPIFQTCGHGETDEDIVTRNSRRGSKFVRKTRQEGLLFAPTPRV
jgi:hypothetical protein